ncbi:hypothetical protein [Caballeronia sp. NK8]|uniref:hypothetical protein n=1 Tax=Caballeronia sp. NK8 TaxID=140098 RepID=UPI001CEDA44B|nr:hypothetical protein [Caballeronia sp. NK8]
MDVRSERADIIDELRNELRNARAARIIRVRRWKKRIDGVYVSYILVEGQLSALHRRRSPCQSIRQTSVIVKAQSPLACRSVYRSCADRCGTTSGRRFLSVLTVLSRRCVRRRNVVSARAFIAVQRVGAASLLP